MVRVLKWCFLLCRYKFFNKSWFISVFSLQHIMKLLSIHPCKTSRYTLPCGACSYELHALCSLQVVTASIYWACGRFKKRCLCWIMTRLSYFNCHKWTALLFLVENTMNPAAHSFLHMPGTSVGRMKPHFSRYSVRYNHTTSQLPLQQ